MSLSQSRAKTFSQQLNPTKDTFSRLFSLLDEIKFLPEPQIIITITISITIRVFSITNNTHTSHLHTVHFRQFSTRATTKMRGKSIATEKENLIVENEKFIKHEM